MRALEWKSYVKTGSALLGAGLLAATPAHADSSLLGLCAETQAQCATSTQWSVQETASPSQLNNPSNAPVTFEIAVTEGATQRTLFISDRLTLDGLLQSGTAIDAIFLSVQKSDGAGGYNTIGSAVVGDASNACGCPDVQSTMTLSATDASGAALAATPLVSLAYGDEQVIALDATWDMGSGLVNPGDALRVQACVAYIQSGISLPSGCYSSGGSVRAVKACSPISLDACPAQSALLTEQLSGLSNNSASASGFTAQTSSSSLSPPSITQTAGGPAVSFSATPTGSAGTVSLIDVEGQVSCTGVGLSTLSDGASIAGASASASLELNCLGNSWSCASLGVAAPYTVFLTHDISAAASDIEGALAAGGAVSLTNYAVGADLSAAQPLALVAGGDLTLSSAWVYGDALFGGSASLSSAGASGTLLKGAPIDFDSAATELAALSSQLAALPAQGAVNTSEAAGTVLSGTNPTLDVFTLTAAELESSWGLSFAVPLSAFAVLNVTGSTAKFVNQAYSTGGLAPQQVLVNFPQATALTIEGVGLQGTVLAPGAAVQFNDGVVEGAILASSLTGDGQSNLAPSPSCIPIPQTGGTTPACDLLGAASAYNVFVSGDYTASSGDVQGAAAAGGDATLSSYTIGALLPNPPGGPALVAGGTPHAERRRRCVWRRFLWRDICDRGFLHHQRKRDPRDADRLCRRVHGARFTLAGARSAGRQRLGHGAIWRPDADGDRSNPECVSTPGRSVEWTVGDLAVGAGRLLCARQYYRGERRARADDRAEWVALDQPALQPSPGHRAADREHRSERERAGAAGGDPLLERPDGGKPGRRFAGRRRADQPAAAQSLLSGLRARGRRETLTRWSETGCGKEWAMAVRGCPRVEELRSFAHAGLTAMQRAQVEGHIVACASCALVLAAFIEGERDELRRAPRALAARAQRHRAPAIHRTGS